MKKRVIILILVVLVTVCIGVGFVISRKNGKTILESSQRPLSPTPVVIKRTVWDDPAGFTFTYDSSMSVNPHSEDNENYSHVELTKKNSPGSIIVWASDTTAQTIGNWVKGQKKYVGAAIIDTTFGGQPGAKTKMKDLPGNATVGALYDGLVFYIELNSSDSSALADEYEQIVSSFTFKPLADENQSTSGSGDESSYDEEEIVQ
jgi:hypothetical protein